MAYFSCFNIGYCDALTLVIDYLYLKLIISFHVTPHFITWRFRQQRPVSITRILIGRYNPGTHFQLLWHGGQPLPGSSFSVAQFSEQVARYIQDMNIEKTNILAYSMHLPAG